MDLEAAKRAFDAYARVEPQLEALWDLCRRAAPPVEIVDDDETDPFEIDVFAADRFGDGWCAEDYFSEHVKPKLSRLAGAYRPGDPHELHSATAYDEIYDLLINRALVRTCRCCTASREYARAS